MCFHSLNQWRDYDRHYNKDGKMALLAIRDAQGTFVGGMPVNWADPKQISVVKADLQEWHPTLRIDLSDVNSKRMNAGMDYLFSGQLRYNGKPAPNVDITHDVEKNHAAVKAYFKQKGAAYTLYA